MRRFGLESVTPLPSNTHLVHFFQHGKDLLEVYAEFCCAGLKDGECCFWVTREPWTTGFALHELSKRTPAIEDYLATGQLRLIPGEDLYTPHGRVNVEGTLAAVTQRVREARAHGWPHVRACGVPCPGGSQCEWTACLEYEHQLHRLVQDLDVFAVCGYRLSSLPDEVKEGLLRAHHGALVRRHGDWHYGPTTA